MKKLIVLIAASFIGLCASAQNKGDMYISGSLSINGGNSSSKVDFNNNTTKTKEPGDFTFSIAPQFGYFVIDNLEVNIGLEYSLSKKYLETENDTNLWANTNLFAITPGVKYYVKICDKFYYTPGAKLSFGFGSTKTQVSPDTTVKTPIFAFGLNLSALAFEFQPCEHLGIMFEAGSLDYTFAKVTKKDTVDNTTIKTTGITNNVNFGLNLGASIGFKYYF